jgi:hypothetical protein
LVKVKSGDQDERLRGATPYLVGPLTTFRRTVGHTASYARRQRLQSPPSEIHIMQTSPQGNNSAKIALLLLSDIQFDLQNILVMRHKNWFTLCEKKKNC